MDQEPRSVFRIAISSLTLQDPVQYTEKNIHTGGNLSIPSRNAILPRVACRLSSNGVIRSWGAEFSRAFTYPILHRHPLRLPERPRPRD